jgi:hypothetical protein
MAYYKIEHEDYEYLKRDMDPELAQEKLAELEDEGEEFELAEEMERMEHAEFFRDIVKPGRRK